MSPVLTLLLLSGLATSPGDTLVDVREGDRLLLRNFEGEVTVETWDRSFISSETDEKEEAPLRASRSGNTIRLQPMYGDEWEGDEGLHIWVPAGLDVEISGHKVEVTVLGLEGDLLVRTLEGDVVLRDLSGVVDVYSAEGEIDATDLSGTARLRGGEDDIHVTNSTAELEIETVDGEIYLHGLDSPRISVKSTDGDIEFVGEIQRGGAYRFFSHSGDITLQLAEPVNLEAQILSYGGEFESDFPARATGFRSGESMEIVLGGGGATMVIETFSGGIHLLKEGRHGTRTLIY
jgi:hypothetical protein